MTTSNFTTSILVDQPAHEVYMAINNVRGWWSEEIDGSTDKLDELWHYHFEDVHRCTMQTTALLPGKKVEWLVKHNFFSFTQDKSEWIGNTITFDISEKDDKTHVQFTQTGLVPAYECYDICENAWNTYIQKSLYNLITTGKGQPNGKDKPQTADETQLAAANFTTTFFVNQSAAEVFDAINNVSGWWHGEVSGPTHTVDDVFKYRMPDHHFSEQQVTELIPHEKVVWLVMDSLLDGYSHKQEWTGSTIQFDITEINNKTQLRFTHFGLVPQLECFGNCSNGWTKLIQESLHSLITTGRGKAVFS